jgi:hypothetical protein
MSSVKYRIKYNNNNNNNNNNNKENKNKIQNIVARDGKHF